MTAEAGDYNLREHLAEDDDFRWWYEECEGKYSWGDWGPIPDNQLYYLYLAQTGQLED